MIQNQNYNSKCENNQHKKGVPKEKRGRLKIHCDDGKWIKIIKDGTFYGRQSKGYDELCPYSGDEPNINCKASESYDIVKNKCDGSQSCVINPKNEVFGDPCQGTYKYLQVKHKCITKPEPSTVDVKEKITCEGKKMKIQCTKQEQTINIIEDETFYGRKQGYQICPHSNPNPNTECFTSGLNDLKKLKKKCNGKNKCNILQQKSRLLLFLVLRPYRHNTSLAFVENRIYA